MDRPCALGAVLVACLGMVGCQGERPSLGDVRPPGVVVVPAASELVTDYEEFTGKTDAIYSVDVRARTTGYLQKVLFKDGDEVKEGDPLFEIDPRPYVADLDRAEATLKLGAAHLYRLEADFRRAKNLYTRHSIGREEYDRIAGDRTEAKAMAGMALAVRDFARLNVGFTRITAPISGHVGRRLVDPGNLVRADDTILTSIVSRDPMYVYFDVDELTLLRITRLVEEGKVETDEESETTILVGLLDEEGFPHVGKVNFSENKVEPNTGTLRLRAALENPPLGAKSTRVLLPGLYTRVRLSIGAPHRRIVVPSAAIGTDQGRRFVYVVRHHAAGDSKRPNDDYDFVEARTVTVGALRDEMRVIEEGLKPGELVIVDGLQRLRPGVRVEVRDTERERGGDQPAPRTAGSTRGPFGSSIPHGSAG